MSPPKPRGSVAPELLLGPEVDRPYGFRQEGWALGDGTVTPVTLRRPYEPTTSVYVLANGWTGDKNSMRLPAHVAVEAGHMAVTFSYTNTGTEQALAGNALEMATVMDALPEDLDLNAMGLSMGGWVTLKALELATASVRSATLIASAGFTSRVPTTWEVIQHMAAESQELGLEYLRDPMGAAKIGYASARNIVRRIRAVRAEIDELVHGSAHSSLEAVKAKDDAPFVRYAYGDSDRLIPAEEQRAGIEGQHFDHVLSYRGGHVAAVFRRHVSRNLFELDTAAA